MGGYIDGKGQMITSASMARPEPETDAARERQAAKLEAAREARRARKAGNPPPDEGLLDVAPESEAVGSPESAGNLLQALDGLGDTEQPASQPQASAGTAGDNGESPAQLTAEQARAIEERHSRKEAYLAEMRAERAAQYAGADMEDVEVPAMPDDADYQACKLAYQRTREHVAELEREEAGLPGRVQDAVEAGDFAALATARHRQSLIGAELEAGRYHSVRARLAMEDAEMPLLNAARQIARIVAGKGVAEIRRATAAVHEAQGEANAADERWRDHKLKRSTTFQQLEQMKADMLKPPPPQHRPPVSMSGNQGADNSGLGPMPTGNAPAES